MLASEAAFRRWQLAWRSRPTETTCEDRWRSRRCGRHSGIPECCIWWSVEAWTATVTGLDSHRLDQARRKSYSPCPRCVEIGFGFNPVIRLCPEALTHPTRAVWRCKERRTPPHPPYSPVGLVVNYVARAPYPVGA